MMHFTRLPNLMAQENPFRQREAAGHRDEGFEDFYRHIPRLVWEGHRGYLDLYEQTWRIAHGNIKQPTGANGFISAFIDTAFNDCTFLWDSAFIVQFAQYARDAYDFMGTLNNFYAKQHVDGFICREIGVGDGQDRFTPWDPASTGPNLFAYAEWQHFMMSGNRDRLVDVFPVLVAYHRWLRLYRTWQDGSYWSCGWGCGLDNSPRFVGEEELAGFDGLMGFDFYHGHHTWLDACLQQTISAQVLGRIGKIIGREREIDDILREGDFLIAYINEKLWDEEKGFYFDRDRQGNLNGVMTVASYWALLTEGIPEDRAARMIAHLSDEKRFHSPHRIPSLTRDHGLYGDDPVYWQGGVWAPTNYMVLQGLAKRGYHDLAREIAVNTLENVYRVFAQTGTLWEYYNPEVCAPGKAARQDFVGWTGVIPTCALVEFIFGITVDAPEKTVRWQLSLPEKHGIEGMPIFDRGSISLVYEGFDGEGGVPAIRWESTVPLRLEVIHKGKIYRWDTQGSGHSSTLEKGE